MCNRKHYQQILLGIVFALAVAGSGQRAVAVPLTLQYQGQVLISGVPHEGAARFKFALLDSNATSVWSHDFSSQNGTEPTTALMLPVTRGLYSVRLGDTQITGMAAIPAAIFTNDVIRLRVWFNDGTNGFQLLSPDREIGSVAFAVRSKTAEMAESLPAGLVNEEHLSSDLRSTIGDMAAQIAALSNLVNHVQSTALAQAQADLMTLSNHVTQVQGAALTGTQAELVALSNHVNNVQGVALAGAQSDLSTLSNLVNNVHLPEFTQTRSDVAALSDQVNNVQLPALNQARTDVAGLLDLSERTIFVSTDANDTNLTAEGATLFRQFDADIWENGPAGSPAARFRHSGVWSGREFIVWGGVAGGSSILDSGSKYDPAADSWVATAGTDAPIARHGHEAVWAGDRMFIWGGFDGNQWVPFGGQYIPEHQRWLPVPKSPLLAREDHAMLWVGNRVAIWGGRHATGQLGDGALFDPIGNRWTPISPMGAPSARSGMTAVWTGDDMIVWGGREQRAELGDGARLSIVNGNPTTWRPVGRGGAPRPRQGHTAVWTGTRMLIWGGISLQEFLDDGGSYDPATDTWSRITRREAPIARADHSALWTGSEMIVLGGAGQDGETATAHAYDPASDTWRALPSKGGPVARQGAATAWTGTEILIFGGEANSGPVGSLQKLNPEPPVYLYRK